jgi:hypothetical protein
MYAGWEHCASIWYSPKTDHLSRNTNYTRTLKATPGFTDATPVGASLLHGDMHFSGTVDVLASGLLVARGKRGRQVVFNGNINAIFKTHKGFFAVNSRSYDRLDTGYLLKIEHSAAGWKAVRVMRLQGGITQVRRNGDQVFLLGDTAAIWLDDDLKPHWIDCAPN